MSPYYEDDLVTLYHGDARELLPHLGRHDAAITDPPYGAPADVKAAIDAAILRLARLGAPFSANDCRREFPNVKGAVIGGRFNALGRAGLIRKTGQRVPSSLGNTNGHEIHVWQVAA
jgi:23S rRNA G2445 N2-methylase RlmL